ncbi:MAG TPA: hypothetical protein VF017_21435 [Thermoanaerobaculia bacterium]|nr:hypothetical protein [Thermoanaerobaculia bacterium]
MKKARSARIQPVAEERNLPYEVGPSKAPPTIGEEVAVYGSPATSREPGSAFEWRLVEAVLAKVTDLARRYSAGGRSLSELGSPEELAARMVDTLPSPSPWNDQIGPFYSAQQIGRVLGGISRQAVAERRARRTLLALRTADGVLVYPTFQFDEHHRVLPGLAEVLQTLAASGVDDWTLAGWLCSPLSSLDRRTPVEWLRRGEDPTRLVAVARDAGRRFAQ